MPIPIDAKRLGNGPTGRASVWRTCKRLYSAGDEAGMERTEETQMDALLHYPPKFNPDYERESIDALGEWELEFRMDQAAREADGLSWRAWELDGIGRGDDADPYIDLAETQWKKYTELKRQLAELENGF